MILIEGLFGAGRASERGPGHDLKKSLFVSGRFAGCIQVRFC